MEQAQNMLRQRHTCCAAGVGMADVRGVRAKLVFAIVEVVLRANLRQVLVLVLRLKTGLWFTAQHADPCVLKSTCMAAAWRNDMQGAEG